MKYKITLADGTEIDNLTLNGDNWISFAPLSRDIFEGNLSPVKIFDGETAEVHDHMELVQLTETEGAWWFVIRDTTAEEEKMREVYAALTELAEMIVGG